MAKEALYISEECVGEMIRVLRAGLKALPRQRGQQAIPDGKTVRRTTAAILRRWCDEEGAYLRRTMSKEYHP